MRSLHKPQYLIRFIHPLKWIHRLEGKEEDPNIGLPLVRYSLRKAHLWLSASCHWRLKSVQTEQSNSEIEGRPFDHSAKERQHQKPPRTSTNALKHLLFFDPKKHLGLCWVSAILFLDPRHLTDRELLPLSRKMLETLRSHGVFSSWDQPTSKSAVTWPAWGIQPHPLHHRNCRGSEDSFDWKPTLRMDSNSQTAA